MLCEAVRAVRAVLGPRAGSSGMPGMPGIPGRPGGGPLQWRREVFSCVWRLLRVRCLPSASSLQALRRSAGRQCAELRRRSAPGPWVPSWALEASPGGASPGGAASARSRLGPSRGLEMMASGVPWPHAANTLQGQKKHPGPGSLACKPICIPSCTPTPRIPVAWGHSCKRAMEHVPCTAVSSVCTASVLYNRVSAWRCS